MKKVPYRCPALHDDASCHGWNKELEFAITFPVSFLSGEHSAVVDDAPRLEVKCFSHGES